MKRLTKKLGNGKFVMADGLGYGENSRAYKQDLINAVGQYEEQEFNGANAPLRVTADSMILGYRVGDLIAVKNMIDSAGDKNVQGIASAIRYGYETAMNDFDKVMAAHIKEAGQTVMDSVINGENRDKAPVGIVNNIKEDK